MEMAQCCPQAVRKRFLPTPFLKELTTMIKLSIPTITLTVFQYTINMTSVIFCGHLGKLEMDAVSLASSLNNALGMTTSLGLVEGYETLFTQAFGSNKKKLMGLYFQRSVILQLLAYLVCISIFMNAEGLCVGLGQHRAISNLTGQYMLRYCPGVFGMFFFTLIARYLQDMNRVIPTVVMILSGNAVNVAAHFLFVSALDWKTNGSAYAVSVANLSMLLMAIVYVSCSKHFKETWPALSMEILQEWGKLFKLGLAAYGSLCFEFWAFEVAVFVTGTLGTTELAAQSLCMTVDAITYNILAGIGITATIRVGQCLGSGDAETAKTACYTNFIYIFFPTVILVLLIGSLHNFIPHVFTNVPDVIDMASEFLPLIAAYSFSTGMASWATGVFRGSGRQVIGAVCYFVAFYLIGLPVAIYLMLNTSFRSLGFWVSAVAALSAVALVMIAIVLRTDWDEQVKKAAKNTSHHMPPVNEDYTETDFLVKENRTHYGYTSNLPTQPIVNDTSENDSECNGVSNAIALTDRSHNSITDSIRNSIGGNASINEYDRKCLVCKRFLIVLGVVMILLAGILCRVFVPLPPLIDGHKNGTQINETVFTTSHM